MGCTDNKQRNFISVFLKITPLGFSFYHRLGEDKNMDKLEYITAKGLVFSMKASIVVIIYDYINFLIQIF